ncbi:hypothetical protein SISSUDRAFT_1072627 [Sistotremastrum suecicum HHB10207 ss-3]|uniref:Uncharacterized protein n=1 Tax=Sistotremastrum suecicum HHB10207 ss-3 TaxID=1314776 RepID=A0A165WRF7_9AGAM|nr:hypothetical protein SISSUDRAFT_1072627 [Sistotremastrum suecicum HHB10207 ss-3]
MLKQKNLQLNTYRLLRLNDARFINHRIEELNDYKRFVIAISTGATKRVDALVRTALNRGASIHAILELMNRAAKGLYKPKNYEEEELLRSYVFLKFGGARAAHFAHRSLGLPSITTVRRNLPTEAIFVSVGKPTLPELERNIRASFSTDVIDPAGKAGSRGFGYILQFDEIAVEQRIRWDSGSNQILGIARETSGNISKQFNTLNDAILIAEDLAAGKISKACEATVAALGAMATSPRVYANRAIAISGTNKTESGVTHAKLIQTVLDASKTQAKRLGGYVMSVASDGESRRGLAFTILTLKRPLAPTSPIYDRLHSLRFMDLRVGNDDLTGDKDWKHIMKRLRNLLLRDAGVQVDGVHITTFLLRRHFNANDLTDRRIRYLLRPDDKQDVLLAFELLREIILLPPPLPSDDPAFAAVRRALNILGSLFHALLTPYCDVTLSLGDQLALLSQAAHISFVLFRHARTKFMPTQLYADQMIMIKNVYFCVAKYQAYNPDSQFHIILLGTDRLESLFGMVRTMTGNDSNADLYQLSHRLSSAAHCSEIFAKHPDWDRSPRRLHLPRWTGPGRLTSDMDHLNPASWIGNVWVSNVSLITEWRRGSDTAETKLRQFGTTFDLDTLANDPTYNILQPFGVPLQSSDATVELSDEETATPEDSADSSTWQF